MELIKAKTQKDFFQIMLIRAQVFMCEQEVDPMIEIDQEDFTCEHYLLIENKQPIGCCRIIKNESLWHLGRIAIIKKYRKNHFGSYLLKEVDTLAKQENIKTIELGAQLQATFFYEKSGYKVCGEVYEDANIDHVPMEKYL